MSKLIQVNYNDVKTDTPYCVEKSEAKLSKTPYENGHYYWMPYSKIGDVKSDAVVWIEVQSDTEEAETFGYEDFPEAHNMDEFYHKEEEEKLAQDFIDNDHYVEE